MITHALIFAALLAILPHEQKLPEAWESHKPIDTTVERVYFFWSANSDGQISPHQRVLIFEHWHHPHAESDKWVRQRIPIYNLSHFYWWPSYEYDGVTIHAIRVNGVYEIDAISTRTSRPIKPWSLRKPVDDEQNDEDG